MTGFDKTQLRRAAREHRKLLAHPGFARKLACHAETLQIPKGAIVGGYHALPDEADPALLLERLVELGCHIAYPRVAGKGRPLEFHRVPDGEVLAPGAFGIHEPLDSWPRVVPTHLLVPLLAFDARGHRLGMGGGFYDRTLERLTVPAIGIAYAGQEISSIPAEPHDRTLDAILTEQGFRRLR
ncbi:MAG TPA: 5-formyltetrahydrofolate cyclo-ligase [Rhizomicrobium sp.]|nr:5-formyltetrahydrofolate cyclo-ligase [Rhizomicrobium sp.]